MSWHWKWGWRWARDGSYRPRGARAGRDGGAGGGLAARGRQQRRPRRAGHPLGGDRGGGAALSFAAPAIAFGGPAYGTWTSGVLASSTFFSSGVSTNGAICVPFGGVAFAVGETGGSLPMPWSI